MLLQASNGAKAAYLMGREVMNGNTSFLEEPIFWIILAIGLIGVFVYKLKN